MSRLAPVAGCAVAAVAIVALLMVRSGLPAGDWVPAVAGTGVVALFMVGVVAAATRRSGSGHGGR